MTAEQREAIQAIEMQRETERRCEWCKSVINCDSMHRLFDAGTVHSMECDHCDRDICTSCAVTLISGEVLCQECAKRERSE
jgi:hypothetical protein